MKTDPSITVFAGGIGPEREISLSTGRALTEALRKSFEAQMIDVTEPVLPDGLDPENTIIFPAIHGTFGEDGTLQTMLEQGGFTYAGSGSDSSRLCMDKHLSKEVVRDAGVRVARDLVFIDPKEVEVDRVLSELGPDLVLKPTDQGSSVALYVINGKDEFTDALSEIGEGNWMVERRVFGREVTIGILGDTPLGVVEVIPTGGVYDYERKYSAGSTEYRYPAVLSCEINNELKEFATTAFSSCGCRDFGRVDFIVSEDGQSHFLEINTLPGLTPTSLLPKSASCSGYDFDKLTVHLAEPALERFARGSLLSA
ncbi:D-alanine--D-alanine ligase [Verrucomicrobia bacterium]|nr:D-alanine--D-alanine ligase [Verrucomicrobiota bacterium]